MVTIPTVSEIKSQILSYIEAADTSTTLLPASFWEILSGALAGALYLLYKVGLWLYKQIFTSTMDSEALRLRAAEYGMTRTPAALWQGTALATGDDDTVISAGKLCTFGDYAFKVLTEVTISGGSISVSLESLIAGSEVNLEVGSELKWSTPQIGLYKTLTVSTVSQEAEDAESDSSFRAALLSRQRNKPQGGAISDYLAWALEVPGVGECFVARPAPGYVNIYPLTDESDPEDRIPSSALLTTVEDYVNDDSRRPFARSCSAIVMTELTFNVELSNLSPNTVSIQAAIESAIENYLFERRPQQYENQVTVKNKISAGEITAIAIAAGAKNITVVLKNSGGTDISSTGYELEIQELAELGSISWS